MADIASIASAVDALTKAAAIVSDLLKVRGDAPLKREILRLEALLRDAHRDALAAHVAYLSLSERNRALEEEAVRAKDWARQRERYVLKEIAAETFAYALKEGVEPPEPLHLICPKCYEDGRRSILQSRPAPGLQIRKDCPQCGLSLPAKGLGVSPAGG